MGRKPTAVFEFGDELPFDAKEDMALAAPVVQAISGGVLHRAHANFPEMLGEPEGLARLRGIQLTIHPLARGKGITISCHDMPPWSEGDGWTY